MRLKPVEFFISLLEKDTSSFFLSPRFRLDGAVASPGRYLDKIELSPDPEVPPPVSEINDFVERSVAASNWHLSVPIHNRLSGADLVRLEEIDDILIYFLHHSVSRPLPIN